MPGVIMLGVIMPGVIMPGVIMPGVVMLSVVIPIVMAPTEEVFCSPPISILIPSFFECKKTTSMLLLRATRLNYNNPNFWRSDIWQNDTWPKGFVHLWLLCRM